MELPSRVGARIAIAGHDRALKAEVEARGFWPEYISPQIIVMRRDYPEGLLAAPGRRRA
jgi:hypothetical protein